MLPLRALLIEDSEDDARLLENVLRKGGFDAECERIETAEELREALEKNTWDIVLTDHGLSAFNSLEALAMVQGSGLDLPVIIVSGCIGEDVAVQAMKAGAHDYIKKDNLARLVPAIERELHEAETRRAHNKAEQTIHYLAYHDTLTGLYNRHEFEHRLRLALQRTRERGIGHALLYLDLDQFKVINDTCGHAAGDALLKQLVLLLQEPIRESDTLARLGGDEFGVLLESCPLGQAQQIAEKLLRIVNNFRFVWQDKTFSIGVSIGLRMITAGHESVSELLSAVDMACYTAKDLGRNRIHAYSPGDIELSIHRSDMQWLLALNQALEASRMMLYQQAVFPLNGQATGGPLYEFYVRLRDSEGRIILPGAFMPSAERYDMMAAVDRWVIEAVFAHLEQTLFKGAAPGQEPGVFFINISGSSLNDDDFLNFVHTQLERHQLPPEAICFDITEAVAIGNLPQTLSFMTDIKKAGCRLALDDFGAGLSSFSYLKVMPVDYLKIDGSFVRDILISAVDYAIVEAINRIGHVAGIQTIAEFVETNAVRQKLQTMGIDYAQGYGLDKPHPV